ncbi:methyl-accepting chemotaxis protein [Deefgea piscis]|uniref:methyl-accepting chemotaxis protein n=1 Tax=Deefgea piscis TaxID=2739061 RepID=UPI0027E4F374|nr:methyl-accepting chemotaxis protein [Deefgea piscis]
MFGFTFQTEQKSAPLINDLAMYTAALDEIDAVIMLADTSPENKIFYMNRTARTFMNNNRAVMNQSLVAGADVGSAMNNSIHQFHRDPSRVKALLQNLASGQVKEHLADIPVGDILFQTKVSPIWGENNKLICFMAQFKNISAERKAQEFVEHNRQRQLFLEERIAELADNLGAMAVSVESVAVQSSSASQSSEVMLNESKRGVDIVKDTNVSIEEVARTIDLTAASLLELGQRSESIGMIVAVIRDVADQTNLLALNAAIEAARAGEQGRGFAVVADEVRKLAERTTKSTSEIYSMVKDIQHEVKRSVEAIHLGQAAVHTSVDDCKQAVEALERILNEVHRMNDYITQIASAAEEQAAASQDISSKVNDLSN